MVNSYWKLWHKIKATLPNVSFKRYRSIETRATVVAEYRARVAQKKAQQQLRREVKAIKQAVKDAFFEYKIMQETKELRAMVHQQWVHAENKIKHTAIEFEELYDYVTRAVQNNNIRYPIEVILKSVQTGISHAFQFRARQHFENWFNKETKSYYADYRAVAANDANNDDKDMWKLVTVTVKPLAGGCSNHKTTKKIIKTRHYNLTCYSPIDKHGANNCALKCLIKAYDLTISCHQMRKLINNPYGQIQPDDLIELYNKLNIETNKPLQIVSRDVTEFDVTKNTYLVLLNNHYYLVEEAKLKQVAVTSLKTKRGYLYFDFETRPDDRYFDMVTVNGQKVKSNYLRPTILKAWYRPYKATDFKALSFATTDDKDCARLFIDWLIDEKNKGRTYTCIGHNIARFDLYFIISQLTKNEQLSCIMKLRGYSVISLNIYGCNFKDSCLYLTAKLDKLCKDFKVENAKQTKIMYNGVEMTNEQLCFYKPHLSFVDFMNLSVTEPEYWKLYEEYCLYDCISLCEIWGVYELITRELIRTINPLLVQNCTIKTCNTLGGLAIKIIRELCKKDSVAKHTYTKVIKFFGRQVKNEKTKQLSFIADEKKEAFLRKFVRGGISHCNRPGDYAGTPIVGLDIKSQYPSCMMNMKVPCGASRWYTDEYNNRLFGYWHISNLIFNDDVPRFKPIAEKDDNSILHWSTGSTINEQYLDTWTIEYLKQRHGLQSFQVVNALVSNEYVNGKDIFGSYIKTFYKEKAKQDALPKERRNVALRESIKLFLNALGGKLIENMSKYKSIQFVDGDGDKKLNGIDLKFDTDASFNEFLTCGLQVYFYSKMLLFEYINMLPNKSDDVIHVETDSMYFKNELLNHVQEGCEQYDITFMDGYFPCIALGEELGNMNIEKVSNTFITVSKKNYYFNDDCMKLKGIPPTTITDDGTRVSLLCRNTFEKMLNGEKVPFRYKTLCKTLFGHKTRITTHDVMRSAKMT